MEVRSPYYGSTPLGLASPPAAFYEHGLLQGEVEVVRLAGQFQASDPRVNSPTLSDTESRLANALPGYFAQHQHQLRHPSPPEAEPRLSHARLAVADAPDVKPYGCNSPSCVPSPALLERAQAAFQRDLADWKAQYDALQADPATAGQRPRARHPSLASIGVCFNASRDLLDHLRDVHDMRQKGEVHVSELTAAGPDGELRYHPQQIDAAVRGEDGKMFRCALIGCQRTWKNANGIQYHCLKSLTALEHNIDTVNRRRGPGGTVSQKRKAEGSPDTHTRPYKSKARSTSAAARQSSPKSSRNFIPVPQEGDSLQVPSPSSALFPLTPAQSSADIPGNTVTAPPLGVPKHSNLFIPKANAGRTSSRPSPSNIPAVRLPPLPPRPSSSYLPPQSSSSHIPALTGVRPSTIPQSGMTTHGYVFAQGEAFRPHNRPVDALYFLNALCAVGGNKTLQQRLSDRRIVNALLDAEFIKTLQGLANDGGVYSLDLVDDQGFIKAPRDEIRPILEDKEARFSKDDVDSAILKLASTLQQVGLGDPLDGMDVI
ncbi:hypothetical protein EMMF5_005482 [Cystobasidiomycetes sp. EMM_F5]